MLLSVLACTTVTLGIGVGPVDAAHTASDNPSFRTTPFPSGAIGGNPQFVVHPGISQVQWDNWFSYMPPSPGCNFIGNEDVTMRARALDENGNAASGWTNFKTGTSAFRVEGGCNYGGSWREYNSYSYNPCSGQWARCPYHQFQWVGTSSGTAYIDAKTTARFDPPAAPSSLNAAQITRSTVSLAWLDNATNEVAQTLQRSNDESNSWSTVATVPADQTTHSDTGLTPGRSYWYRIRASNTYGDSEWSNEVQAIPGGGPGAMWSYVAYGDSITTGFSANACSVFDRTLSREGCVDFGQRPADPYPLLVSEALGGQYLEMERVGIWGQTADDAREEYEDGTDPSSEGPWPAQLRAVDNAAKLVTGSLGINDMEFSDAPFWTSNCITDLLCLGAANERVESDPVQRGLNRMFDRLAEAGQRGATVMVTLYYIPVDPNMEGCDMTRRIARTIVERLNLELQEKALLYGTQTGAQIQTVDLVAAFEGHGLGSADPYVYGKTCRDVDALDLVPAIIDSPPIGERVYSIFFDAHPNCNGGEAIARAIVAALARNDVVRECIQRDIPIADLREDSGVSSAGDSNAVVLPPMSDELDASLGFEADRHIVDMEPLPTPVEMSVAEVSERCMNASVGMGMAEIRLTGPTVVAHDSGSISVPCTIRLADDSSLTFENVTIHSSSLAVIDEGAGGNALTIENSRLTGTERAGFYVRLEGSMDRAVVENSLIDYPRSVWVHVAAPLGDVLPGGSIRVASSVLRSLDPQTEGVMLVSGGNLELLSSDLSVGAGELNLVYGRNCLLRGIEGVSAACP